ncbi:MAG: hypothetical protein Fur0025_34220 [Oscillatoriaceae cyanobacterium]
MAQCPVCNTEYVAGKALRCSVCNWDLQPVDLPRTGKFRQVLLQQQGSHLDWAREIWQKYKTEVEKLSPPISPKSPLEERLEQLEAQVKAATQDREALRGELTTERDYRYYIQSQVEWLISRLEQNSPEQMQQSIWELQQWLHANYYQQTHSSHLASEVGMDYSGLEALLAKGKWRQADEKTWEIFLRLAQREEQGWLSWEDIYNFPGTDLGTIDWLWENYSGGRFGFRVQQGIWEHSGGDYTAFCDRVGWRINNNWLYYDDINFSLEATVGHLPIIGWRKRSCYGVGPGSAQDSLAWLVSRFAPHPVSAS